MAKRTQRPEFEGEASDVPGDRAWDRARELEKAQTLRERLVIFMTSGSGLEASLNFLLGGMLVVPFVAMLFVDEIESTGQLCFVPMMFAGLAMITSAVRYFSGLSKPSYPDPLTMPVRFKRGDDAEFPYRATVDSEEWTVRLNEFPDEPLYTLLIEGEEFTDFDDWPPTWTKPVSDD